MAATAPASKCVTATTVSLHEGYQARLEKDVAPYASNANAATAIKTYRNGLDTAWDAMNEPYCGAGVYGVAPFIKSYNKSVERERAAFLAAVIKLPKDGSAPVPVPVVVKPVVKPVVAAIKTSIIKFLPGLHRGLRSDQVMDLQKFLTAHFGIKQDDSIITGYFGPKTEGLVIKYQLEKKIIADENADGAGLVGPKTSASLNAD